MGSASSISKIDRVYPELPIDESLFKENDKTYRNSYSILQSDLSTTHLARSVSNLLKQSSSNLISSVSNTFFGDSSKEKYKKIRVKIRSEPQLLNKEEKTCPETISKASETSVDLVDSENKLKQKPPPIIDLANYKSISIFSESLLKSQNDLKSNSKLRISFVDFILNHQNWLDDVLQNFNDHFANNSELSKDLSIISMNDYIFGSRAMSQSPLQMGSVADKINLLTNLKIKDACNENSRRSYHTNTLNGLNDPKLCFSSTQLLYLLIPAIWSKFLLTEDYRLFSEEGSRWSFSDEAESNLTENNILAKDFLLVQSIDETDTEIESNISNSNSYVPNKPILRENTVKLSQVSNVSIPLVKPENPKVKNIRLVFKNLIQNTKKIQLIEMLQTGDYLYYCLEAIEKSRFSISLSVPVPENKGFPLVLVNKAFETLVNYDRNEILGQSCSILQCPQSERTQIDFLSAALKGNKNIKLAITNRKKNMETFLNLLALKPILTNSGSRMVLGIQYDISNEQATLKDLKLIDDILVLISLVFRS